MTGQVCQQWRQCGCGGAWLLPACLMLTEMPVIQACVRMARWWRRRPEGGGWRMPTEPVASCEAAGPWLEVPVHQAQAHPPCPSCPSCSGPASRFKEKNDCHQRCSGAVVGGSPAACSTGSATSRHSAVPAGVVCSPPCACAGASSRRPAPAPPPHSTQRRKPRRATLSCPSTACRRPPLKVSISISTHVTFDIPSTPASPSPSPHSCRCPFNSRCGRLDGPFWLGRGGSPAAAGLPCRR